MTDPHIHIFDNNAYLFSGRDVDYNARDYTMKDWLVWSSSDLINWKLEYTLDPADTYIGSIDKCFATDAAERNGKYYWYISNYMSEIAVVEATKPGGPFHDKQKKPLIPKGLTNCRQYDPTIFIDDDKSKTPYLFFGETWENDYHIVKLNSDMVSLAEESRKIEIQGHYRIEDKNFVFKRNGIYYLVWGDTYAPADNVYVPYRIAGNFFGSRNSVFECHNQWFMAVEDYFCTGCTPFFKGSSIHYLHFKSNGVPYVDPNNGYGVGEYDASRPIMQAENYFEADAIDKVNDNVNGFYISPEKSGAWSIYPNIYGLSDNETITFNVSSKTDQWTIEVYEENPHGKLLGSCKIPNTQRSLQLINCKLSNTAEKQNLCMVFVGKSDEKPLVDYFSYPAGKDIAKPDAYWDFKLNTQGWRTLDNQEIDFDDEK